MESRINSDFDGALVINNCNITHMMIIDAPTLTIRNSNIGKLHLHGRIRNLTIHNSNIYDLEVSANGPAWGDFYVDNDTCFPTKTKEQCSESLLDNFQVYSNVRNKEASRGNTLMVNLFNSLEYKASRNNEVWPAKFFNYAYSVVSDYGASYMKPLGWFALFFLMTMYISYSESAAVLAQDKSYYKGWQTSLTKANTGLNRSFVLTAQSIANPVGIFGTRNLVIADKDTFTSKWLFAYSILSILFLAMFIFALRRRFKIQG